jgi:hypothetical protein
MQNTITTPLPAHGAPYEGGFFGGVVNIHGMPHAVVWAPKAKGETTGTWHDREPGLIATSCFDSMANTQDMAAAGSAIASWALGLHIDGHADWCIPARDVLELAYRHLKPTTRETTGWTRCGDNPSSLPVGYPYRTQGAPVQTTAEAFQEGGDQSFDSNWHWSSTQSSSGSAWVQYFLSGHQYDSSLDYRLRVRAVRLIQLSPSVL